MCAFVFTGLTGKFLGVKPQKILEILESFGYDAHVFYDKNNCLYLDGGKIDSCVDGLSGFVGAVRQRYEVNVALGSSGAGYMALRQAAEHGLDAVAVFNGFVSFSEAAARTDRRGRSLLPKLHALEPEEQRRDACHFLRKHQYSGIIEACFSQHSRGDAYQARLLKDFDTAHLRPVGEEKHGLGGEAQVIMALTLFLARTEARLAQQAAPSGTPTLPAQ